MDLTYSKNSEIVFLDRLFYLLIIHQKMSSKQKNPQLSKNTSPKKSSARSSSRSPGRSPKKPIKLEDPAEKKKDLKAQLRRDAQELLNYVTIEMTVGSQMDSTRKKIKELTEQCKQEQRMILDLEKLIKDESPENKPELQEPHGEEEMTPEQVKDRQREAEAHDIEYISQRELELRELYAELARLKRQKH